MNLRKAIILAVYLMCAGGLSTFLPSCSNLNTEGLVIFTRVPAGQFKIHQELPIHQYPGAQIVALEMENPAGSETILTVDFTSACSPFISYDAKRMLFLAREQENEPWQVWEMDLKNGNSRKITDFEESCSGPAYLPGDRLVFSRIMPNEGYGSSSVLFTMNLDGTNLNRITFQPHLDHTATVLSDGRVLMRSSQLYPEKGDVMYLALRPNGTKTELFHRASEKSMLGSQVHETTGGEVYFTQWEKGIDPKRDLFSVHQNRPLYSSVNHTSEIPGSFYSVFSLAEENMLVSYQPSETETAGLYYFSPKDGSMGDAIIEYSDYHIVEPVLVEAYTRPRHLPDEVNKEESTGQLFCQDINVSAMKLNKQEGEPKRASMIEILGLEKSMGKVAVEEDGSFYLKVMADTPFRIQTLDEGGNLVNGPSGWLWVRPFERRGCVGCHEDPELVPKNFVPLAVKKQPVSIPVEGTQETTLDSAVKKKD